MGSAIRPADATASPCRNSPVQLAFFPPDQTIMQTNPNPPATNATVVREGRATVLQSFTSVSDDTILDISLNMKHSLELQTSTHKILIPQNICA